MPELQRQRKTVKITLPSSSKEDPAIVEAYTDLRASDIIALSNYQKNPQEAGAGVFCQVIKSWNLTIDGEIANINVENIGLLPANDLLAIIEEADFNKSMKSLNKAKKKK